MEKYEKMTKIDEIWGKKYKICIFWKFDFLIFLDNQKIKKNEIIFLSSPTLDFHRNFAISRTQVGKNVHKSDNILSFTQWVPQPLVVEIPSTQN